MLRLRVTTVINIFIPTFITTISISIITTTIIDTTTTIIIVITIGVGSWDFRV